MQYQLDVPTTQLAYNSWFIHKMSTHKGTSAFAKRKFAAAKKASDAAMLSKMLAKIFSPFQSSTRGDSQSQSLELILVSSCIQI